MIVRPSIAFNDFSGTASEVTARNVDVYLPVVYANASIDVRGAALSEAHLQGNHLSCINPDAAMYTANNGTFFQFFAVRDGA